MGLSLLTFFTKRFHETREETLIFNFIPCLLPGIITLHYSFSPFHLPILHQNLQQKSQKEKGSAHHDVTLVSAKSITKLDP